MRVGCDYATYSIHVCSQQERHCLPGREPILIFQTRDAEGLPESRRGSTTTNNIPGGRV
jgi:hypothetical protein